MALLMFIVLATGNIKAQEADSVAGIINNSGLVCIATATDAKTGRIISVVATFDVVRKLPWDIVILFGGGFALAKGFQVTGLSAYIGNQFNSLAGTSPLMMIVAICSGIIFLT
jgi:di/tricarboxylate transporter